MKRSSLLVTVSGARGIVGEGLTPDAVTGLTLAFAALLQKKTRSRKILVGRDPRPTGEAIQELVTAAARLAGMDVEIVGVVATPTILHAVRTRRAAGAIAITASHNPIEWNALKFFIAPGRYLRAREVESLRKIWNDRSYRCATWKRVGSAAPVADATLRHVRHVLSAVSAPLVRKKRFRVAMDFGNSSGVEGSTMLLERLGCRIGGIHDRHGVFERVAEPRPDVLTKLSRLVRRTRADVGFALDPDADRLVFADERGRVASEELTLVLAGMREFRRRRGAVVVNMSTSRAIEDIADRYGFRVLRSPTGETNVTALMEKTNAFFGGEGNGGVIHPGINMARDPYVGMALILEEMARSGRPLSALLRELPSYAIVKRKIPCPNRRELQRILARLPRRLPRGRVRRTDGLRIDFPDSWVLVRVSNTEPIVRITAEARSRRDAERLSAAAAAALRGSA